VLLVRVQNGQPDYVAVDGATTMEERDALNSVRWTLAVEEWGGLTLEGPNEGRRGNSARKQIATTPPRLNWAELEDEDVLGCRADA